MLKCCGFVAPGERKMMPGVGGGDMLGVRKIFFGFCVCFVANVRETIVLFNTCIYNFDLKQNEPESKEKYERKNEGRFQNSFYKVIITLIYMKMNL